MSMSLTILDTANNFSYLAAGLRGDGTSNSALMTLANKITAAASVVAVIVYVVVAVVIFAKKSQTADGTKDQIKLLTAFAFVMGGILSIWGVAKIVDSLTGGAIGR